MTAARTLLLAFLLTLVAAAPAGAQATRTWVSGTGDDAMPCSRTAPCKTIAGAYNKTAEGGEINAIDPGPYGAVNITKALTVDLSAAGTGGVLNGSLNGVIVAAGDDDDVVLRGLDILGGGPGTGTCRHQGLNGVVVRGARSVTIEDSRISRQQQAGIWVPANLTDVRVFVNRVDIANTCQHGVEVAPEGGQAAQVMVRDTTITNAGTAVSVGGGGHAWLTGTTIFGNALGLETLGGGVIESFGDNRIVGNTVDGAPTRSYTDGPAGPAGPPGPAGPAGPQGPAGEAATRLIVALQSTRLKAVAGRRVTLGYVATADAKSTLLVRRAGRTVARVRGTARPGRNRISWNGRIGRRAAKPGRYSLTLRAASADGQAQRATAKLRLRKRR